MSTGAVETNAIAKTAGCRWHALVRIGPIKIKHTVDIDIRVAENIFNATQVAFAFFARE